VGPGMWGSRTRVGQQRSSLTTVIDWISTVVASGRSTVRGLSGMMRKDCVILYQQCSNLFSLGLRTISACKTKKGLIGPPATTGEAWQAAKRIRKLDPSGTEIAKEAKPKKKRDSRKLKKQEKAEVSQNG
jgi:hypothetical protein